TRVRSAVRSSRRVWVAGGGSTSGWACGASSRPARPAPTSCSRTCWRSAARSAETGFPSHARQSRVVTSPDVLVVGAGPAGAGAARALARRGAGVLLRARAPLPRNKAGGGAISMRAIARCPWLSGALGRISTHSISTLYLEGPSGAGVTLRSPAPAALMIRRVEFDHLLVQLAVEAGAELIEGVEIGQAEALPDGVRLRARDGRTFDAPLVVAADGVYSVVARRLGLNGGWRAEGVALD